MKAYVFSIGERTTDLCCELMEEYGFDVTLYQDQTSLWDKLKRFYTEALETKDQEFVRIDADIIPYPRVANMLNLAGWTCAWGFDWYKQDLGSISIHKMNREVIKLCLKFIEQAKNENRPETYLWRHKGINDYTDHSPGPFGLHGYGQTDQRGRIRSLKDSRSQSYNWDLVERIEAI